MTEAEDEAWGLIDTLLGKNADVERLKKEYGIIDGAVEAKCIEVLGDLGSWGVAFWSMMVFLGILTVGFVYEWRKGALEWD